MDEIIKDMQVDRKVEGPRTEFLGPANILWVGVLAKETKEKFTVCQALAQHFHKY